MTPATVAAHPRGHPAGWSGILQADAYAGFNGLHAKGSSNFAIFRL